MGKRESGDSGDAETKHKFVRITERTYELMLQVRAEALRRMAEGALVGFRPKLGLGHVVAVSLELHDGLYREGSDCLRRARDVLVERLGQFLGEEERGLLRELSEKALMAWERKRPRKGGA